MTLSQELVSIIIPVYNKERVLMKCIESVRKQTYTNLQIILVNDGSTDESLAICRNIEKQDNRILVIDQDNGGVGKARNTGLNFATGKYICFVDADDYIQQDYIEVLLSDIISVGSDIATCNYFYEKSGKLKQKKMRSFVCSPIEAVQEMWHVGKITVAPWAKLYKKNLWDDVRFPEYYAGEDYATTYKVFLKANKISYLGTPKYVYCYDEGSLSNWFGEKKLEMVDCAECVINDCVENYPLLLVSAKTKSVDMVFQCLCQVDDECFEDNKARLTEFIYKYRNAVLCDRKSRVKSIVAVIVSYINPVVVRKIYRIRWKNNANC